MDVVEVGLDHRGADLALRERVALPKDRLPDVLRALATEPWLEEAVLLSTCNRTELYAVTDAPDGPALALAALRRVAPAAPEDEGVFSRRIGDDAAVHLVRVAAGLESAILGESEIQAQVRDAHRAAREAGVAGPVLDRLASTALRAGKRTRTETGIGAGAVSHGHAAYEATRRVFGGLERRTVLVVGAGEMATLAARSLTALEGGRYVVANRTEDAARALAATLPSGIAIPLAEAAEQLREAHVVVLAGGADAIPFAAWEGALRRRRDPLLVLDFGVPRCVAPAVGSMEGVFLHDLEAIERWLNDALRARRDAVPAAEAIVEEEVGTFRAWRRTLRATPSIRSLHAFAEAIRAEEAARLPADAPAALRAAVDALTRRIVDRLLRRPTARVRRGVEAEDPSLPTPEALENLFGLREADRPGPAGPKGTDRPRRSKDPA